MHRGLIINPVKPAQDESERVADIVFDFFEYCTGAASRFPSCAKEELEQAAADVRAYNQQRAFGGSCILWPSQGCIDFAWGFFHCGEHQSGLPAVKIGRTERGELYFYL